MCYDKTVLNAKLKVISAAFAIEDFNNMARSEKLDNNQGGKGQNNIFGTEYKHTTYISRLLVLCRSSLQRSGRDLRIENTDTFSVFSYFFLRQTLEERQGEGLGHTEFWDRLQPTGGSTWMQKDFISR